MAALATVAAMAFAAAPAQASALDGHWINPSRTVIVRLGPCGGSTCGTVTWATEKAQRDAQKGVDKLIGAQLLSGFQHKPNGYWQGKIFVPDLDIRVVGKIQKLNDRQLKVSGCLIGASLCRSQVWARSDKAVASAD